MVLAKRKNNKKKKSQTKKLKTPPKTQTQPGSSFPSLGKAIFMGRISTLLRKEFPVVATGFVPRP